MTRAKLLLGCALVVLVPGALHLAWPVLRDAPVCEQPDGAYVGAAVPVHLVGAALLLAVSTWTAGVRVRWFWAVVALGAVALVVPAVAFPVAAAGFLLAAGGAGLTLLGLSALLLAYAAAHPRALVAGDRRADHARLLALLLWLAALGVVGQLAHVLTAGDRACGA